MKLLRPLTFIDIEASGLDVTRDRVIQFGAVRFKEGFDLRLDCLAPDCSGHFSGSQQVEFLLYPGFDIRKEIEELTGITNEMLRGQPDFATRAEEILRWLSGTDLAGFNLWNMDLPMLSESFDRLFDQVDLGEAIKGAHVIDAGNIFKKKEERSLTAALKFYCAELHASAHGALADSIATAKVLAGQIDRYGMERDVKALADFSEFEKRVDIAGKIAVNADGDYIYNFGQHRGTLVIDNPGLADWMLNRDFTGDTKRHLRRILQELFQ